MSRDEYGEHYSEASLYPADVCDLWDSFGLVIDDSVQPRCTFCHETAHTCSTIGRLIDCADIDRRTKVYRDAVSRQRERIAWFDKHRPDIGAA